MDYSSTPNIIEPFDVEGLRVRYEGGNDITDVSLKPTATKEEGVIKQVNVELDSNLTVTPSPTMNLLLELTEFPSGLAQESFKWEVYKNEETIPLATGNFSGKQQGDTIEIVNSEEITEQLDTYKVYLWIDGNMENSSDMLGNDFTFTINATGVNATLGYYYELEGIIYREDGSVCDLCDVTILPENLNTKTAESGYYYFEEIPTGIHTLVVEDEEEEIIKDKVVIKNAPTPSVEDNTVSLKSGTALMVRASAARTISSLTIQNQDTLIVRKQEIFNYEYNTNLDIKELFTIDSVVTNGGFNSML